MRLPGDDAGPCAKMKAVGASREVASAAKRILKLIRTLEAAAMSDGVSTCRPSMPVLDWPMGVTALPTPR